MTTTAAKLEILQEYADWRDQVELAGVDSSIDAYREHLDNLRARDTLKTIRGVIDGILPDLSSKNPGDVARLLDHIRTLADIEPKEITPA